MVTNISKFINFYNISFFMNLFKLSRIEKNLSILDIVKEIRYPISVIEDIENDVPNFLPKPYAYYCVKSYGEYLGISNLIEVIKKYK